MEESYQFSDGLHCMELFAGLVFSTWLLSERGGVTELPDEYKNDVNHMIRLLHSLDHCVIKWPHFGKTCSPRGSKGASS